jgi:hypothetical protein
LRRAQIDAGLLLHARVAFGAMIRENLFDVRVPNGARGVAGILRRE